MPDLEELASLPIFSNSWTHLLLAVAIAATAIVVLFAARGALRRYSRKLAATPQSEILEIPVEVLSRSNLLFIVILSLYMGFHSLEAGTKSTAIANSAMTIAFFWQAGLWAIATASAWLERKRRQTMATDRAVAGSLGIIGFIVSGVIWAMVVLLTLDNLGVNITALVAGLGIGGIAVALAVQNVLGDLFASLSIALDKPFVVGDFLIIDDFMGSVEYIGIKSTRLRSLSGEQIVLSNSDLLKSRLRNYGRMNERRVVFSIGVTYDTPIEKIEEIPGLLRSIVAEQKNTRLDRSHFQKHGASSLDFETVYYVLSADYNQYMDIQQAINLRIHREFAARGIEFAFPTQTLMLSRAATPGATNELDNEKDAGAPRAAN